MTDTTQKPVKRNLKTNEEGLPLQDVVLGDFTAELCPVKPDTIKQLEVGIFKLGGTAKIPAYGTEHSACFDIASDFDGVEHVTIHDKMNTEMIRNIREHVEVKSERSIMLNPGDRATIPTNLIFDIPVGYKMLVYPRSGISRKEGLNLINSVGVVDSDYVEPVFLLIHNTSGVRIFITSGERLAQGEIVPVEQSKFTVLENKPGLKTDRTGGLGHTGKK